jgi:hypothetical protein
MAEGLKGRPCGNLGKLFPGREAASAKFCVRNFRELQETSVSGMGMRERRVCGLC